MGRSQSIGVNIGRAVLLIQDYIVEGCRKVSSSILNIEAHKWPNAIAAEVTDYVLKDF